jgi:hypothetical protein
VAEKLYTVFRSDIHVENGDITDHEPRKECLNEEDAWDKSIVNSDTPGASLGNLTITGLSCVSQERAREVARRTRYEVLKDIEHRQMVGLK